MKDFQSCFSLDAFQKLFHVTLLYKEVTPNMKNTVTFLFVETFLPTVCFNYVMN